MEISSSLNIPVDTINLSTQVQRLEKLQEVLGKSPDSEEKQKNIKEAAVEFESFLLYFLIKTMRETIPEGGLLGGGNAQKIYTSLLDESMAKNMALRGGIGLSEMIEKNL